MINYRTTLGCNNCLYVFRYTEYDDGIGYYCELGEQNRPMCGSSLLKEEFTSENSHKYQQMYDLWREWANRREVEPNGICDAFIEK